jgi:hypothetical protein
MPVNWPNLITAIDAETSRLQQARKLLAGSTGARGSKPGTMSAEGRARISAAMKKRWAKQKRTAKA